MLQYIYAYLGHHWDLNFTFFNFSVFYILKVTDTTWIVYIIDIEFHLFFNILFQKKASFSWCNIASSIYCWEILVYFGWYNILDIKHTRWEVYYCGRLHFYCKYTLEYNPHGYGHYKLVTLNNIWRKLWLNNIKRCFWQIFKISVHAYMFCYMP
jgi:hypothetical protein